MTDLAETNPIPSRLSATLFWGKAALLQWRRGVQDIAGGVRRWTPGNAEGFPLKLAESRTELWSESSAAERRLQWGKVQNLRQALRRLDSVVIPAGATFSFWKQIGRATRRRGFAAGRLLREGCLMPAVGGGLCQLSNALYQAALEAGLEIVERHPHSRIVPGSAAEDGRDATVAWNYIDLRFRPAQPMRIEARLTKDALILRFWGGQRVRSPLRLSMITDQLDRPMLDTRAHSCASCGVPCFRQGTRERTGEGRTAFLVDEGWPEFQEYLSQTRTAEDLLGIPLDGARWHQPRYAWDTVGYARVGAATAETLVRSLSQRRLAASGPARRRAEIAGAAALARRLARLLTPDVTHLCVAQSLLPFLFAEGHLGGRTFDVLMTRLPMAALQARLDGALAAHPERGLLGDFRAPDALVQAETQALEVAERIITPHRAVAALFPDQALLLDWQLPKALPAAVPGRAVAFPGPTAARKGAYELRAVARDLGLEIVLLGSELEGAEFWQGVKTRRPSAENASWLEGVALVAQPALVEERPRRLLVALASGTPVIATAACGLGERPGVVTVPPGDEAALRAAILGVLESKG